jgi:hypothetical protein
MPGLMLWAPVSRCEQGCKLSLDRLRQQRSCAAAQHLRQRIGKSSRLGELENASQPQIEVPSPSTTIALKHPYFADDMKLVSHGCAPTEASPGPKQQASLAHGVFRLCHLQAYAETFVRREGVGLAMRDYL